jgi:hypothetical protein
LIAGKEGRRIKRENAKARKVGKKKDERFGWLNLAWVTLRLRVFALNGSAIG